MRSTLRLSVSRLMRTPRWTLPILLTLVVGIGATAAVFSVMDTVLLRSYPYREPGRLVVLHDEHVGTGKTGLGLSEPEFVDYRGITRELSGMGAYTTGRQAVFVNGPEQVQTAWVSEDLLPVLGVQPREGRDFTAEEEKPGGPPVALVSHEMWRRQKAVKPDQTLPWQLRTTMRIVQVVGVLPEDFRIPSDLSRSDDTDLFLPLRINPADMGHRQNAIFSVVGRLAPHATVRSARAEQDRIVGRFMAEDPTTYDEDMGFDMSMATLAEDVVGGVRRILLVVCGAVALLFLIALANAAGLILTRLDDRRQEMGIRIALGARFAHLFRGFAVESLVLTAAAVIPAIVLAWLLGRFLLRGHGDTIPRLNALAMDQWVLLFVAAAGLVIVLVFATASSVRIARSIWPKRALTASTPVSAGGLRPGVGRRLLAGGQIAFTVALTVGAAFLISSYRNVSALDLGFNPRGVLLTDLSLPTSRYQEPARVTGFFNSLVERTRALPGVESAALVAFVPLETPTELWPVQVQGAGAAGHGGHGGHGAGGHAEGQAQGVDGQVVSEGFFHAMGMTMRSGRDFRRTDATGAPVVVVDDAFVKERFGGQNPLGRNVRLALSPTAPWATVVGVVADARHASVTDAARPHVYFLHDQIPQFVGIALRSLQLVVRTSGDPDRLAAPVRGTIRSMDPELALGEVRTMDSIVGKATSRYRFPMQMLGIFALMALVVSLSGIYGVISQTVAGSTRELGIRMALGAAPGRITAFVLRQGLLITLPAVLVGLVAAVALARVSTHLFYGITAGSVGVYLVVGLGVIAAATLACLLPARRAARLEATVAIREGV